MRRLLSIFARGMRWLFNGSQPQPAPQPQPEPAKDGMYAALHKVSDGTVKDRTCYPSEFEVKPPSLMAGVVPPGTTPAVAMDSDFYTYAQQNYAGMGFPGYPYLAQLATRAEFRQMASAMGTELTREWIEITGSDDTGAVDAKGRTVKDRIKGIEEEFKRLNVRGLFAKAAEHDCYYGRGQIFLDIQHEGRQPDHEATPLILDPRTVPIGSLKRIATVEAVWTTPNSYNSNNPAAPDFYKPSSWFMLGREVHATRLLTIISREVPDLLKPAFNFGGISLSQLAEPYVNNWLRTRQSVSDLINNFSITAIKTIMDQVLAGHDDGTTVLQRAELFTKTRSNKGLMILDKEAEELVQINTPLSGLHELQAQSQEHMCSVSRMPATVLTGIQPSGLNATGEGEQDAWYDWIAAQQEAHWRNPLEIILKIVQLSLFGAIDPAIGITFKPLFQMTPEQEANIRKANADTDTAYVDAGVLDPQEVRERIAKDPASGYHGLDTTRPPPQPEPGPDDIAGKLKAVLGSGGEEDETQDS